MLESALQFSRDNREKHLAMLCEWLRIPSVSTLPEHAAEVRQAAEFAAGYLRGMGMPRAVIHETAGHPIVSAEWLGAPGKPTLLIYGHFDVQPTDPDEEWVRPPFDPQVEGDFVYARGASDDKGQAFAILAALESYFKSGSGLPVNVKVLLEGEEEVTSPNLFPFLREHARELAADAILVADQDMLDAQHPVVMWGVRGNLYAEIEVRGPSTDLHSGTFGGAVDNPINVLMRLLAGLQDGETRKVLVPGFYDDVEELTEDERALIAQAPINDQVGFYLTGVPALGGETGYPLAERVSVRPTYEVHGIEGGFTGKGMKTVIPARAAAKVSMRLVPYQDPEKIAMALEKHLRSLCPNTVHLGVRVLGKAHPVKVDYKSAMVQAAVTAYEMGFSHSPIFLRGGGSLPIVYDMVQVLSKPGEEIPLVMIGFGLPDDGTHAPNEKFYLPNFYQGIDTVIHYLHLISKGQED